MSFGATSAGERRRAGLARLFFGRENNARQRDDDSKKEADRCKGNRDAAAGKDDVGD